MSAMLREGDGRSALVTGASAGIGAAFARHLAARGYDLILTARRADRLEALAAELTRTHGVSAVVLPADLADPGAPAALLEAIEARGLRVDVLINNAGYGVPGTFLQSPWAAHAAFLQVMVTAMCELAYRVLPGMEARRSGCIVNVASFAALIPGVAGHTQYAASKAFLVRFSESLALEAAPHGVHVSATCPGFTYSEFHDVNGMRATVSRLPGWLWLDAGTVAAESWAGVTDGRAVVIPGRVYRVLAVLVRLLPAWVLGLFLRRNAGKFRKT
ncbi:MAG: SDR family oxidoreductase [Vicinamibacterales bacterium]|nr:SDR family oxidoreductase [Vicinamibacterales bacterium]